MFSFVLLAAGQSRRFGSPKALARINDETVIEHLQKNILMTNAGELIIVLGAHRRAIKPFILKHRSIKVVYNKHYKFGQTTSFQAGLKAVSPGTQGIILLPTDYPFIKPDTLRLLTKVFLKTHARILIPSFHGRRGHPPLFRKDLIKIFMALSPSVGINTMARLYHRETRVWEVTDEGVVLSFNTKGEFIKSKSRWKKLDFNRKSRDLAALGHLPVATWLSHARGKYCTWRIATPRARPWHLML